MNAGLALGPGGELLMGGMAILAILLFALASWRGWWPLWIGGYFFVIAALLVAFLVHHPASTSPEPGGPSGGVGGVDRSQRTAPHGVLEGSARPSGPGSAARASEARGNSEVIITGAPDGAAVVPRGAAGAETEAEAEAEGP